MITVTGTVVGAETVQRRLMALGETARARVRAAVERMGIELQRKAVTERLTGQALHVRSGRLRRSITERLVESSDAISSTVGTNLPYGRFWELGFRGVEHVRAHTRRVAGHGIASVRAHDRTVDQEARPFLRPSLDALRGEIRTSLTRALEGLR